MINDSHDENGKLYEISVTYYMFFFKQIMRFVRYMNVHKLKNTCCILTTIAKIIIKYDIAG